MAVHAVAAARRDHGEARQHILGDAPVVIAVLGIAPRTDVEAAGALHHLEHRAGVIEIVLVAPGAPEQRIGIDVAAMQERHMAGIDAAFHRLQPVAFLDALRHEALRVRHQREFPFRQGRPALRRPEMGPQHAATLDQRIGLELDPFGEAALHRLRRHLHALAVDVELPAVIGAAQPAFLVAAEPQRRPAMGTEFVDQPEPPAAVAERDQPFRKHLDPHRRTVVLRQLGGEQHRRPVAAEQCAHRGSRPGLGDEFVLVFPKHAQPPGDVGCAGNEDRPGGGRGP